MFAHVQTNRRIVSRNALQVQAIGALYLKQSPGYNVPMSSVIHYEDNIYIVDGLVRVLCDASRLEPDPDVIGDAMLATARLTDSALRRVKDLVLQNDHLVDRPDYLRLLSRSSRDLADALDQILRPGSTLAPVIASAADELARIVAAQRAAASDLRDMLNASTGTNASSEDVVSGDELSELLRI
jgi:hypothetical protein